MGTFKIFILTLTPGTTGIPTLYTTRSFNGYGFIQQTAVVTSAGGFAAGDAPRDRESSARRL